MSRKWKVTLWVSVLVLSLVVVDCGKKKAPITPPEEIEIVEAPAPPAPEVKPPTAPPTAMDPLEKAMSEGLVALNNYVREAGLIGDVYFDFDKYDLRPDARDRLAKNAQFMQDHSNLVFSIEGHCDERGTNEYNLALGEKRASTAVSYLSRLGAATSGISTISYGEERPACTQHDESCWWQNRRAHFVIVAQN